MALPLAAISAGIGVATKLFGKKQKRPDNRRAIAELRASRPTGYLTPEDYTAAERTRGRLSEGLQAQGQLGQYEIGRRFRARGLTGSPSEERSLARLNQQTLLGQEHAGEAAQEQLYNTSRDREAFERQKALSIFGAQVGENVREQERIKAEQGAFWNSLNEFMPAIIGGLGGGTAGSTFGVDTMPGPTLPGETVPPRGFIPGVEPDVVPT